MALIQDVLLRVARRTNARDLVRLFLDLIAHRLRRRLHIKIPVEPADLLLAQVVLRHTQHMSHTVSRHQITRRIRHDQILRQHIRRYRPLQIPVVVNLLEGRSTIPKVIQHLIVVGIILLHLDRDLVVHIVLYTLRLGLLFRSNIPSNHRPGRPTCRKHFLVSLRLKLCYGLVKKRVNDTSRTVKRFRPFLIREAKQRKPLLIRLLPIITPRVVVLNQPTEILTDLRQISLIQHRRDVVPKTKRGYIQGLDVPAKDHRRPAILVRLNSHIPIRRKIPLAVIRKSNLGSRTFVHRHRVVRKGLSNSRIRYGH